MPLHANLCITCCTFNGLRRVFHGEIDMHHKHKKTITSQLPAAGIIPAEGVRPAGDDMPGAVVMPGVGNMLPACSQLHVCR